MNMDYVEEKLSAAQLPRKSLAMFEAAYRDYLPDYGWIIKADDDTCVADAVGQKG